MIIPKWLLAVKLGKGEACTVGFRDSSGTCQLREVGRVRHAKGSPAGAFSGWSALGSGVGEPGFPSAFASRSLVQLGSEQVRGEIALTTNANPAARVRRVTGQGE